VSSCQGFGFSGLGLGIGRRKAGRCCQGFECDLLYIGFHTFLSGPTSLQCVHVTQFQSTVRVFVFVFASVIPHHPAKACPCPPCIVSQGCHPGQNVVWATAKKGLKISPILFKTRFLINIPDDAIVLSYLYVTCAIRHLSFSRLKKCCMQFQDSRLLYFCCS